MFDRNAYRKLTEKFLIAIMIIMLAIVFLSAISIFAIVTYKGFSTLNFDMITKLPGNIYDGKPHGILNAIVGSFYLAGGSIIFAMVISVPLVFSLQKEYVSKKTKSFVILILDLLWGIPSIVYGAIGYVILISLQQRASLLGGIITLGMLGIPIMSRAMLNVVDMVPKELREASYSLGATRFETMWRVVLKQALPGMTTAVMLTFGRVIGDTASVLFTAGYSDELPRTIYDGAASLPLLIYYNLTMPGEESQKQAYAATLLLLIIVLTISVISRILSAKFNKYTIN